MLIHQRSFKKCFFDFWDLQQKYSSRDTRYISVMLTVENLSPADNQG